MPLLTANQVLRSSDYVPDRVAIGFTFLVTERGQLFRVFRLLGQGYGYKDRAITAALPLRRFLAEERNPFAVGAVRQPYAQMKVTAHISRGEGRTLDVILWFNVLEAVRGLARLDAPERSDRNERNWLLSWQVSRDNRWVGERASEIIDLLSMAADDIANRVARLLEPNSFATFASIRVCSVEIAIDFISPDPAAMLSRLEFAFLRQFLKTERRFYRRRKQAALQILRERGSVLYVGFKLEVRYKAYQKTNSRVRLECKLANAALSALGINRQLLGGGQDFPRWFAEVVEAVSPTFEEIRVDISRSAPLTSAGPLELLSAVAASVRRADVLQEAVRQLVQLGRIDASLDRNIVIRLRDRGIVIRTTRGIYALSPRYRRAAETLRRADECFYRLRSNAL